MEVQSSRNKNQLFVKIAFKVLVLLKDTHSSQLYNLTKTDGAHQLVNGGTTYDKKLYTRSLTEEGFSNFVPK